MKVKLEKGTITVVNRGRRRTRSYDDHKNKKVKKEKKKKKGGIIPSHILPADTTTTTTSRSGGGEDAAAVSDTEGGRKKFLGGRRPTNKKRTPSQDSSHNSYQSYDTINTAPAPGTPATTTNIPSPSSYYNKGGQQQQQQRQPSFREPPSARSLSKFQEPPSLSAAQNSSFREPLSARSLQQRKQQQQQQQQQQFQEPPSSYSAQQQQQSPPPPSRKISYTHSDDDGYSIGSSITHNTNGNQKKKKKKKGLFQKYMHQGVDDTNNDTAVRRSREHGSFSSSKSSSGNGNSGTVVPNNEEVLEGYYNNNDTTDPYRQVPQQQHHQHQQQQQPTPTSTYTPTPTPTPTSLQQQQQQQQSTLIMSLPSAAYHSQSLSGRSTHSTREHALSYGDEGSIELEFDTSSDDDDDDHDNQGDRNNHRNYHDDDCPDPEFHGRDNNRLLHSTRSSGAQSCTVSDHLQIHHRHHNSNESRSEYDTDDYDDEFFLTGTESGHSEEPIDIVPDYSEETLRHQKVLSEVERLTQKKGLNPQNEKFKVCPDLSYKNTWMTRKQLRAEMNTKSAYYNDLRMLSHTKQELGHLHVEILQCFGLPSPTTTTPSSIAAATPSAYGVAVHGQSAFQTDVIPSVANPMWLSKMRRACLFPIRETYSKLYIGIFDLEATIEQPQEGVHKNNNNHNAGYDPRRVAALAGGNGGGGDNSTIASESNANADNNSDSDNDDLGPQPAPFETKAKDFIGHVIIDICRLRPGSTYDVTLPLRRSAHVFTREPQGSVRVRLHVNYHAERSAVTCYLPKSFPGVLGGTVPSLQNQANIRYTVNCVDDRSARNVAHTIHGIHMPGKFSLDLMKATIREMNWTRIHVLRYLRKRELYHLTTWVYPSISGFVFLAWMHSVYANTISYIPGHLVVFFLLHLLKNYAYYAMDSPLQNGFIAPTIEELYWALIRGTKKRSAKHHKNPFIEPLTVEKEATTASHSFMMGGSGRGFNESRIGGVGDNNNSMNASTKLMDELYDENGNLVHVSRVPLTEIADKMRKSLTVQTHRKGFSVFKHAFEGDAAVDFLCAEGYAHTRPEAVFLGRRLQQEKQLFQHVSEGVHSLLEDAPFMYHFLEYDSQRYIITKSHVPQGGRILELLGFYSRGGNGGGSGSGSGSGGNEGSGDNCNTKVRVVGGADILESREHVEFPFATGIDHPRFTVKESLVIRSDEAKETFRREEEAKAMVDVAEFGIVPTPSERSKNNNNNSNNNNSTNTMMHPGGGAGGAAVSGYESERDTAGSMRVRGHQSGYGHSTNSVDGGNSVTSGGSFQYGRRGGSTEGAGSHGVSQQGIGVGNFVGRTARRGSLLVGTAVNTVATTVVAGATTVVAGAGAVTGTLTAGIIGGGPHNGFHNNNNNPNNRNDSNLLEVATNEEMYKKLRNQNNAELDKVLELQRQADEYDPYAYDSDTDVHFVDQTKRKKYILYEKHLKKPMSQEIGASGPNNQQQAAVDMSLAKALQKGRRQVYSLLYHLFDDQVYKIDRNLFPTRLDAKAEQELFEKNKKKKKRGLFNRRVSSTELKEEEERQRRLQMTPFERRQDEMDKVLLINQYSHSNPWINRVALVMQPMVEMAQAFLFALRAVFNVFTWQDPILCFWICFVGPFLAVLLYIAPYRILFGMTGVYVIGPQNFVLRLYRETRAGYQPPDFDTIVKKKKIEKVEDFQEMQFFSSEAPGNQQIKFRNIDPTQVKQIVVPSNVLMYNRFYDWPPEPEYARVYASPPPRNLSAPGGGGGFVEENEGNRHGYESDSSAFIFDAADRKTVAVKKKKKKKKKKGFRKFTHNIKKGTRASIGFVENAGGVVITGADTVVDMTTNTTVGAVKGTANITKNVVKGTGKQAKSAAKGTGNFLRLRRRKKKYDEDDNEYY